MFVLHYQLTFIRLTLLNLLRNTDSEREIDKGVTWGGGEGSRSNCPTGINSTEATALPRNYPLNSLWKTARD